MKTRSKASFGSGRGRLLWSSLLLFAIAGGIVLSIISFVLTLVSTVAGKSPGELDKFYILSVNMTQIGENVIQFTPTTTSSSGASDPLTSALAGLVGNITSTTDDALTDVGSQLVSTALDGLVDLPDFYNIYPQNVCEVRLANSSTKGSKQCFPLASTRTLPALASAASQIPSSITIGTTNISIPLLNTVSDLPGTLQSLLSTLAKAILAFNILSLVSSGTIFLLSILVLFRDAKLVVFAIVVFASLGIGFQFLSSIIGTILAVVLNSLLNNIGPGLGIASKEGEPYLALTWISFIFLLVVALIWVVIYWHEFRGFRVEKQASRRDEKRDRMRWRNGEKLREPETRESMMEQSGIRRYGSRGL